MIRRLGGGGGSHKVFPNKKISIILFSLVNPARSSDSLRMPEFFKVKKSFNPNLLACYISQSKFSINFKVALLLKILE